MGTSVGIGMRARRGLAWAALAGALWLLAGCAAGTARNESTQDIPTASDEGDVRKRTRIRLELATGYFEQGKTDIALDEVKQALAADPNYADAYNLRGLIYMRLGDNRQAEESFRRAISINARDPNVVHNLGWLQCQTGRFTEAQQSFNAALAAPGYTGQPKTWLAQGICQARAGRTDEAEKSLAHAYELDAGNPVTGYNLAAILYRRGEFQRAQFYIRRLNNSEYANAETLWLGIRVERRMNDTVAMRQLGDQLRRRYGSSREAAAYERGSFDE